MLRVPSIGFILFFIVLAVPAVAYEVGDWTVVQLTDNENPDTNPRVSGGTVVWTGMDDNFRWQIFMWRDGVTTQLTYTAWSNAEPSVGGDLVIWRSGLDRIFAFDGTFHELTPTYEDHGSPIASRNKAAWLGDGEGNANDVYYYDGTEYTQLTFTNAQENYVQISGSSVTWWNPGTSGTGDIYYFEGTEAIQLTDNTLHEKYPKITDNGPGDFHITYEAYIDGFWDVMQFDGSNTVNLSNTPGVNEISHQSCGNRTVWSAYEGGQHQIWLHDGNEAVALADSSVALVDPQVSDTLVTWWAGYYATEIFVYDGTAVTQLTDNEIYNHKEPQVDGGIVVWYGNDGNDDEIFMAYRTPTHVGSVPDASALTIHGAQPNPFNPSTEIVFSIGSSEQVSVKIFDLRGHLVKDLGSHLFESGQHSVAWNGRNGQGQVVSSGVYFYQVETPGSSQMGKLTLVE